MSEFGGGAENIFSHGVFRILSVSGNVQFGESITGFDRTHKLTSLQAAGQK
jgi:hypothetical protein